MWSKAKVLNFKKIWVIKNLVQKIMLTHTVCKSLLLWDTNKSTKSRWWKNRKKSTHSIRGEILGLRKEKIWIDDTFENKKNTFIHSLREWLLRNGLLSTLSPSLKSRHLLALLFRGHTMKKWSIPLQRVQPNPRAGQILLRLRCFICPHPAHGFLFMRWSMVSLARHISTICLAVGKGLSSMSSLLNARLRIPSAIRAAMRSSAQQQQSLALKASLQRRR